MKRWLKRTVVLIAVLNLMMLTAAAIPVHATGDAGGTGGGASIGDGGTSGHGGGVPPSCYKCGHCHGFWKCLWWCARCVIDLIA